MFEQADIPAARLYSIDDVIADEHVQAIGFVQTVQHPTEGEIRITAIPTEWSESVPENRRPAPGLGEHTHEVLLEFGYAERDIAAMQDRGVLGALAPIDTKETT